LSTISAVGAFFIVKLFEVFIGQHSVPIQLRWIHDMRAFRGK
jgi:hypothetical protein